MLLKRQETASQVRRRRKVSVYIVLVVKFISDFFKESKIGDHQERLCVLMCSQQLFWGEQPRSSLESLYRAAEISAAQFFDAPARNFQLNFPVRNSLIYSCLC
jgi:hypothetical protein